MNRLWVRLSGAFGTVVIAVLVIIAFSSGPAQSERFSQALNDESTLTAEQADALDLLVESGVFQQAMERAARGFPAVLLYVAAVTGIAAIVAGILLSRYLTRPLTRLQQATRAIGANDLSTRVDVSGSEEMVELGRAFNQMAADLESAESLRNNLLADVAHELRTPLTVIQGNLRAILDDVYPLDKGEIARLYDQTRHINRLVDDLRALAQAEARRLPLHRVDIDVAALVNEMEALFRPIAQANGVTFRAELLGALPPVSADADRIKQSVSNLLSNAIYHTPSGGAVTLQAEAANRTLELRVSDTGEGMAPEHLAHVFDRFYRVDSARSRERGATGLGLAITKAIVEAHDGTIRAESPGAGQGATFTIRLPLT